MSDSELRRLALGDRIRLLRKTAGLSGKQVAQRLGWAASKLSRIERNRQPVTDADIVGLAGVFGLDTGATEELRDELRAIRLEEARWSRQLVVGHHPVQERVQRAEAEARSVDAYNALTVHGLLQTAGYARAVFEALDELRDSPRDVDAAVRVRMQRQQVLYESDRRFTMLVTEAALRLSVAPPDVMRGQLDRLIAVADLPNLRIGIIPLDARLPVLVMHDFSIRDQQVTVELGHTETVTSEPADVDLYRRLLDRLWTVAVTGDAARALIARVAGTLAG